jgi:hypothetical protein
MDPGETYCAVVLTNSCLAIIASQRITKIGRMITNSGTERL